MACDLVGRPGLVRQPRYARAMYVVAIAALGSADPDLQKLAADLGTTLYELRLVLNAGLPAVVVLTVDISVAANAARAIERHGHRAVSGDRRQLASGQAMINVVDVAFDPAAKSKKFYLFRTQSELQIFADLRFIENNGRGTISFGSCTVAP